jgi:cell division protein FtsX
MVRPRERGIAWRQVAKWARMVLVVILLVLLGLILVVMIRTAQSRSFKHQTRSSVLTILKDSNHMKRVERLSGALKIETVSYEVGKQNNEAFLELHKYIKNSEYLIF